MKENNPRTNTSSALQMETIRVALLTGGGDRHYAYGLAMALASKGVRLDVIGSDEIDSPEMHRTPMLTFLNLRRNTRRDARFSAKAARIILYYLRLCLYAARAKPKIFHILWNNKFEYFDRTLLMLCYKLLGKKIVITAHNVNAGMRDSSDSFLNRLTLRFQYRLSSHIFVHTEKMRGELHELFAVPENAISVIRFGFNNAVPDTELTPENARRLLGIKSTERTILFFGNIAPYKGLEYLIAAFEQLVTVGGEFRLVVAGRPKKGCDAYVENIRRMLDRTHVRERTILKTEFIPDNDTEIYFKAADVSVLPYTHIFQSGILFLGYTFGLPAIAADVGSLKEDIIEGRTGYLFRPKDVADLANVIERYFDSELYRSLSRRRPEIREYYRTRHSWDTVGELTKAVYRSQVGGTGNDSSRI